jgi:hypothetical protein
VDIQFTDTGVDDVTLAPFDGAFIIQKFIFFPSRMTDEENGSVSGVRYVL